MENEEKVEPFIAYIVLNLNFLDMIFLSRNRESFSTILLERSYNFTEDDPPQMFTRDLLLTEEFFHTVVL